MKLKRKQQKHKNQKGMAVIEAIPVLFMVVVVFNFSLGFFGAIHSGILNSIGSYNYTMETFRFRSNLMYFRPGGGMAHYQKSMNRVHGVTADGTKNDDTSKKRWPATVRPIAFNTNATGLKSASPDTVDHTFVNRKSSSVWKVISTFVPEDDKDSTTTPEIWIKTVYGICLNADCEDKR